MEARSLVRLLLDQTPDDTEVGLDLSELTGCCVNIDPGEPVAGPTRRRQLASLPVDAPVIILTEGSTDSVLLTKGMQITHPHLMGFVRFIDYAGTDAEGSASALARTVRVFHLEVPGQRGGVWDGWAARAGCGGDRFGVSI